MRTPALLTVDHWKQIIAAIDKRAEQTDLNNRLRAYAISQIARGIKSGRTGGRPRKRKD